MPGIENTPKHAAQAASQQIEYGAGWGGDLYQDVQCPSGSWCKIRRNMDPIELLNEDDPAAEQHDVLGAIVRQKVKDARKLAAATPGDPKVEKKLVDDVDDMLDSMKKNSGMTSLVNSFIIKLVVKPELHFPPEDPTERKDGMIYVDTVPFQDRMFLFDLAMKGTSKAARFHSVVEGDVESVVDGENVSDPA